MSRSFEAQIISVRFENHAKLDLFEKPMLVSKETTGYAGAQGRVGH